MWVWRRGGGGADGGGGPARLHRTNYGLGRLPQQGLLAVAVAASLNRRRHRITSGVLRLHTITYLVVFSLTAQARSRKRATER